MNRDELKRIRAFVAVANDTMASIPQPIPPRPIDGWDGAVLPTEDMYLAYNRLPTDVQGMAAYGYALCMNALDTQASAAEYALIARYQLFHDIANGVGLTSEQLSPNMAEPQHYLTLVRDEDEQPDPAAAVLQDIRRRVERHIISQHAKSVQADADTDVAADVATPMPLEDDDRSLCRTRWCLAAASLVAVASIALLAWQHLEPPVIKRSAAAHTVPVNRSMQDGDLAVIVSHTEDEEDATAVYVHLVNTGDEPRPAALSLGGDDSAPAPTPVIIPAHSTRHSVLEVRKHSHNQRKPLTVQVNGITRTLRVEFP